MKQLYTLRRTLSAIILLLVSALPCMATMFKVDGIKYRVNENDEIVSVSVVRNTPSYSGDIVIPSTVTYEGTTYSVTSIVRETFKGCTSITSISLPESVTSIGDWAFYGCTSLTSISLPKSVTSIGVSVFEGCTSLTSISLPEGVTSIEMGVFSGCTSLTSISIPKSVTSIENSVFLGCTSLTSIIVSPDNTVYDSREGCNAIIETSTNTLIVGCKSTIIPEGVTSIGSEAFKGCTSLTSMFIPESVTSIGDMAFRYCTSLTTISIPEGVTSIGWYAFCECTSLTSISLPESMTSIGDRAFEICTSLTSISLPEGVTSIGEYTFSNCTSLTSISLPESLTSIGEYAFNRCTSLTTIVCRAKEVPELSTDVFLNVPQSEATLYVPSSSIEAYRAAEQWKDFGKILPLEEYTTGIDSPTAVGADTGVYDVYTIRGTLIRKGCNSHNLNGLPAGAYILRHGNESKTVVKR